jgi:hypothetical protein
MERPTKRKAFNFLRSYFDVINELQNDSDKLQFVMAVINKQFLDEDPKDLNFVVNLCYQSQKHAVESSVKGWKRVSNTDLIGNPMTNPMTNPPTNPPTNPKEEEEEEEVKEEEEDKLKIAVAIDFDLFWNIYNKKVDKEKCLKVWRKIRVEEIPFILEKAKLYIKSNTDIQYRKNPLTWLNGKCWNDEISAPEKKIVYASHNRIID